MTSLTRTEALRHRAAAQGLTAAPDSVPLDEAPVLDIGVQDTGPDGALWALAQRGVAVTQWPAEVALAWTVRGAPHAYRARDLPDVALATAPLSEADAAARVVSAAKPLRAAGISVAEALGTVATAMRRLVREPMVKGDVSGGLTAVLPAPYLRWCRPCNATHPFEMTFRLAALHAGLTLEPGTSPPVLVPNAGWPDQPDLPTTVATPPDRRGVPARLDVVLACVRLLGPARPADVAAYLDAPKKDVGAVLDRLRSSGAVTEVQVDGETRLVVADGDPKDATEPSGVVRLLGPYDLFLQARDRDLLVPDRHRHAGLWPVLGRPGAVLADGEVVGTWRPRAAGSRLRVTVEPWLPWDRALDDAVDEQIASLAAFRGLANAGRA